jgi:hypothetical protein
MSLDNNNDTNSEIAALKNQMFMLLVALVVVTGSLTVYLYRQDSILGKQCTQLTAVVNQTQVSINNFIGKLVDYGQKHPEFDPVLKKYGLTPQSVPPKK